MLHDEDDDYDDDDEHLWRLTIARDFRSLTELNSILSHLMRGALFAWQDILQHWLQVWPNTNLSCDDKVENEIQTNWILTNWLTTINFIEQQICCFFVK